MKPRETLKLMLGPPAAMVISSLAATAAHAQECAQTLDPMHMTPDEFVARLRSDYDKYQKLIRSTGARAH